MPEWLKLLLGLLNPQPVGPPPFVPTFEGQHYVTGLNQIPVPLNPEYFADERTALEIMKRFKGERVASIPFTGSGGPEKSDARERWVVWSDGIACNAGKLAAYFTRNPEDKFPRVAENAVWHDIAGARTSGQKLPTTAGV